MKRFLTIIVSVFITFLAVFPCSAISSDQEKAIVGKCTEIKTQLKNVQKNDARTRVHLGGRYETILTKYIVPLNVRLVENSLSNAKLVENQNEFAETRTLFNNDYISYQQNLEELVAMDCTKEPKDFYEKLDKVRNKRKIVEQDVLKLRSLISKHLKLVTGLKGEI